MKFHELSISKQRPAKRVGRGISAGQGKTAGRGTKGQGSRTGFSKRPGFEGGQNPLMQRLPKLHGFRTYKTRSEVVFTGDLNGLGAKVDNLVLAEKGLVSNPYVVVKLLNRGEVTKKIDVKLQAASASAVAALQEKGGSFEKTARLGRTAKPKADK